MRVCTQQDATALSLILADGDTFNSCGDDGLGKKNIKKSIQKMLANPSVTVLIPKNGVVVSFVKQNAIMHELHVIMTKRCQFNFAERVQAARDAAQWMIRNRGARKFIAQIPEYNRGARILAVKVGLSFLGRLEKSFQKNGKLHDLMVFQSDINDVLILKGD